MTDSAPSFNLVDEPWIPVVRHDGAMDAVSLFDAIARGDEFTQIVGDVPTQVFAIQRVLLAILHRAVGGPGDLGEWQTVVNDWPRTLENVGEYLREFRDRFYLFHPTAPFFQVADLRTAKGVVWGLEKLIADVPNGVPYLTTRIGSGLNRVSAPEAARWLVHVHAFDPDGVRSGAVGDPRVKEGKGYGIGSGWSGQIGGVSLVGASLRQTLQLNLVVPKEAHVRSGTDDRPPWERPPLTEQVETGGGRPEPRGLVDLYTWQTRRVRLVGDGDGVTGLVLAQGDPMTPQNRQDIEPMTAWRYSEPQTKKAGRTVYMPRQHVRERQFWRGIEALLPHVPPRTSNGVAEWSVPGIVQWASALRSMEARDGIVRLRATGIVYGTQNATVEEIIDDALAVPLALLGEDGEELEFAAVDAVERAELAARAVGFLAKNLAMAAGASSEDDGPRDRAREQFYAALDAPFRRWLSALSLDETTEHAAAWWQRTVRDIAMDVGGDLLASAGPAAWKGREVRGAQLDSGRAEVWFRAALRKALPRGFPGRHGPDDANGESEEKEGTT